MDFEVEITELIQEEAAQTTYNVFCRSCGTVWLSPPGDSLHERAVARALSGRWDALSVVCVDCDPENGE